MSVCGGSRRGERKPSGSERASTLLVSFGCGCRYRVRGHDGWQSDERLFGGGGQRQKPLSEGRCLSDWW